MDPCGRPSPVTLFEMYWTLVAARPLLLVGHPAFVLAFENPHMVHFWKTQTLLKTASLPPALSPPTRKPISPEE